MARNNKVIVDEIDNIIQWCEFKVNKRRNNTSINKLEEKGYEDAIVSVLRYLNQRKEELTFVKKCEVCGVTFKTPTVFPKFCDKCRVEVRANGARARNLNKAGNDAYSKQRKLAKENN